MELHKIPTTGASECIVSIETMVTVRREPGESDEEVFEKAAEIFEERSKTRDLEMSIQDEEDTHEWVTPPGDYD